LSENQIWSVAAEQQKNRHGGLWRIAVEAPDAESAQAAIAALDTGGAVSAFETTRGGSWTVECLVLEAPDRALIEARLELAWQGRDEAPPTLTAERVPAQDWVGINQASFPPLVAGRYFIHGSHFDGRVPASCIALLIDAATAFGTGEHGSTRGCLLALDALARRMRPRRILDMGTGTGVLAIAAAKTWRRPVRASDIDAESVRVARHNARRNGVATLLKLGYGPGYRSPAIKRHGPYDLMLANILARPLVRMAPALARNLAPRGFAVLAGLLPRQEATVLAAHRASGLHLVARATIEGWRMLILARARPAMSLPSHHRRSDPR
jgi:ribosomal protein L11 methyltransferase